MALYSMTARTHYRSSAVRKVRDEDHRRLNQARIDHVPFPIASVEMHVRFADCAGLEAHEIFVGLNLGNQRVLVSISVQDCAVAFQP
jgi:hypothetical protein